MDRLTFVVIDDGLGRDMWMLEPRNISSVLRVSISGYLAVAFADALQYFWVEEMLYSYCVSLYVPSPTNTLLHKMLKNLANISSSKSTKMSIVLFYLRIFPSTVSTTFRKICWILVGLFIAMPTAFALATAFQCNPVSFSWTGWDGQHE